VKRALRHPIWADRLHPKPSSRQPQTPAQVSAAVKNERYSHYDHHDHSGGNDHDDSDHDDDLATGRVAVP
jgi:hypothetical protein